MHSATRSNSQKSNLIGLNASCIRFSLGHINLTRYGKASTPKVVVRPFCSVRDQKTKYPSYSYRQCTCNLKNRPKCSFLQQVHLYIPKKTIEKYKNWTDLLEGSGIIFHGKCCSEQEN